MEWIQPQRIIWQAARKRKSLAGWEQQYNHLATPETPSQSRKVSLPVNVAFLDAVKTNDVEEVKKQLAASHIHTARHVSEKQREAGDSGLTSKHRQWTCRPCTESYDISSPSLPQRHAPAESAEEEKVVDLQQASENVPENDTGLSFSVPTAKTHRIIDINASSAFGMTALHLAAMRGQEEIVSMLLANGAEIDAVDDWGWTPLHTAAAYGQRGALQLLLKSGADPTILSIFGKAAVDVIGSIQCSMEVLALANGGTDVEDTTEAIADSLWEALAMPPRNIIGPDGLAQYKEKMQQELYEIAEKFCQSTESVGVGLASDQHCWPASALNDWRDITLECLWQGNKAMVERMLELPLANPNVRDNDGWSLLAVARARDRQEIADLLLNKYHVDKEDDNANTESKLNLFQQHLRARRQWLPTKPARH